jgi:hypothetical protein
VTASFCFLVLGFELSFALARQALYHMSHASNHAFLLLMSTKSGAGEDTYCNI